MRSHQCTSVRTFWSLLLGSPNDAPDGVERSGLPVIGPEHRSQAFVRGSIPDELVLLDEAGVEGAVVVAEISGGHVVRVLCDLWERAGTTVIPASVVDPAEDTDGRATLRVHISFSTAKTYEVQDFSKGRGDDGVTLDLIVFGPAGVSRRMVDLRASGTRNGVTRRLAIKVSSSSVVASKSESMSTVQKPPLTVLRVALYSANMGSSSGGGSSPGKEKISDGRFVW